MGGHVEQMGFVEAHGYQAKQVSGKTMGGRFQPNLRKNCPALRFGQR